MTRVANEIENMHPWLAWHCYHYLGTAHRELGREGGIEQAIVCFQKTIELSKKLSNKASQMRSVVGIAECYVMMKRIQEAMNLHKNLALDPGYS